MFEHATTGWRLSIALSTTLFACAHAQRSPGSTEVDSHAIPGFEAFHCAIEGGSETELLASERRARADALTFASDIDYVRLGHHAGTERRVFAERGAPCERAGDSVACTAKLTQLEARSEAMHRTYAITIAAHEVSMHVGEAVFRLVGVVDTPADAWLVLMVREGKGVYECKARGGAVIA